MTLSSLDFRVVVVGDIIIDHDIIVRKSNRRHTNLDGEMAYEVDRRYTTVGGAGGSARVLAMLNGGETHLAGFSAPTIWAEGVRAILEECRKYDNSPRPIRLLVVWTAEGRGAVVSRLVVLDQKGVPGERPSRWDDASELALPSYRRQALPDLIKNSGDWDGILLSDLNRGTIDRELVRSIADYAQGKDIPLVIIPKWVASYYRDIEALAIIPNLKEWCELTKRHGEDAHQLEDHFRRTLNRPDRVHEMATRSVVCFPRIKYHIITCDADGVVIVGPILDGKRIAVNRLKALEIQDSVKKGAGDAFTAQFLLAYLELSRVARLAESDAVHGACRRGVAAAAAHLTVDWQRMATVQEVAELVPHVDAVSSAGDVEWPIEAVWGTVGTHINLGERATALPGIVSQDRDFSASMAGIAEHIEQYRDSGSPPGLLIGAPSGDGKSAILRAIATAYAATSYDGCSRGVPSEQLAAELGALSGKVVIIDEADKAHKYIKDNIGLIQRAIESGILFVFAGSGFRPELETDPEYTELYGRCKRVFPKPLAERLGDIVLILAARISARLEHAGLRMPEVQVPKSVFDRTLREAVSKGAISGKALDQLADQLVDSYKKNRAQASVHAGSPSLHYSESQDSPIELIRIVPPARNGGAL
jgi:sugar/nucleoside kinase (ribokinase family)